MYTTIMVNKKLKKRLDKLKTNSKESYQDVISHLVTEYIERYKLEGFIKKAQKEKMKELWDNEDDEAWDI